MRTRIIDTRAVVTVVAIVSFAGCGGSRSLDQTAADRLARGLTVEAPSIRIPAGVTERSRNDSAVVRAYRRLSDAGVLRCDAKLTDCRAGPRASAIEREGNTLHVTLGYLVVDQVNAIRALDDRSAKAEVFVRFRPTNTYRQHRAAFTALTSLANGPNALDALDSDATASALFRRFDKTWRVADIHLAARTGTASWRSSAGDIPQISEVVKNLAPLATVSVSSEDSASGQVGSNAADGYLFEEVSGGPPKQWVANTSATSGPNWIRLTWKDPVQAWEIILYDRPNPEDNVLRGTLVFSDGSSLEVQQLPNDGSPYRVEFDPKTVSWVQFNIGSATGPHPGLGEIEVFGLTQ